MEVGYSVVTADQEPSPNHRVDAANPNVELVDFGRACILHDTARVSRNGGSSRKLLIIGSARNSFRIPDGLPPVWNGLLPQNGDLTSLCRSLEILPFQTTDFTDPAAVGKPRENTYGLSCGCPDTREQPREMTLWIDVLRARVSVIFCIRQYGLIVVQIEPNRNCFLIFGASFAKVTICILRPFRPHL